MALVGGTISDATGGKFANGAVTGALQQAFNGELSRGGGSETSAQNNEEKDRFIFDEKDSKEIIEFFFKGKTEGIDPLGPKGRVLATDMYQDAWDINFDILDVKDAMGNPLSKAPLGRAAKSTFSFSETVFRIKLAINPASSPLEVLQRMQLGGATRAAISGIYANRVRELR